MAGRAGRGGRGCSPPVSIPHGRRCCTLGASPAPRRGRREGCGRARPALVCIADRARRFCAVRRLIEEWPRIEGRAIEGPGMRHKGQRNEERPCSTALLHRAARARRRGLFAKVYRRHADRAVLRPSSGCRHRATSTSTYTAHFTWVDRITCKPRFTRVGLPVYRTASVVGRVRVCAPEAAPETSEKKILDISRPAKIGYTSQEFGGKEWSSAALSGGHAFQVGMMREGLARA